MNKITTYLKFLLKSTSKLTRIDKLERARNWYLYLAYFCFIVFELGLLLIYIHAENWFNVIIISIVILILIAMNYKFYHRKGWNDAFLKKHGGIKVLADVSIMGADPLLDTDTLSLEAIVTYLEERIRFDDSSEAKCIRSLIEFYDKHKNIKDE